MPVTLRPYQSRAVGAVRDAFRRGARAPLLVVPTGGGKTVIFSHITDSASGRGSRVLILLHRRELIRQTSAKLHDAGVPHGIIAPGHTPMPHLVQVASVQTLGRRLGDDRFPAPDLIVPDEAHHAIAGQWATILRAWPQARILGVTATPERMDGRGLGVEVGGIFDSLVMGPSVAELVGLGHLTDTVVYAPPHAPDLSRVRTRGGDYDAAGLRAAMDVPSITGDAVAHYARHAPGQPAILFATSVAHAEAMAQVFRAQGWRAVAASGETPPAERDAAIAGLATGAVQVLCACDLISEGLDVPAVSAVILLRPTKSLGLYLQQVGRGLRPAPGKKHLVVLDHAGNTQRHGLVTLDREWSLRGRVKRETPDRAPPRCDGCGAFLEARGCACQGCGWFPEAASRPPSELLHIPGELRDVTAEARNWGRQRRLDEVLAEASDAELPEVARQRGYLPGWVKHRLRERASRRGSL
jgi:superfamily II DNA or RNA helicase